MDDAPKQPSQSNETADTVKAALEKARAQQQPDAKDVAEHAEAKKDYRIVEAGRLFRNASQEEGISPEDKAALERAADRAEKKAEKTLEKNMSFVAEKDISGVRIGIKWSGNGYEIYLPRTEYENVKFHATARNASEAPRSLDEVCRYIEQQTKKYDKYDAQTAFSDLKSYFS